MENETVAAVITVLLVAVIVVAPSFFITARLVSETKAGVAFIQAQVTAGNWRDFVQAHAWLSALDNWVEQELDLSSLFSGIASWLTNSGTSFARTSALQLIGILIAFYVLFYLLRDRREALATVSDLSPLPLEETDRLGIRIADTVRAVVFGTLVVAAVQGALGAGIHVWLLDLRPLVLGARQSAIVGHPGTWLIRRLDTAAILLAIEGDWGRALALSAWGALIIGTVSTIFYARRLSADVCKCIR